MNENLKYFFMAMSLSMFCLVIYTQMKSDLLHLPQPVLDEPWFWTTLVDFYNNIAILACWVIYKEGNWLRSLARVVAFIVLGSIATAFYVFVQFKNLKEGEGVEAVLLRRA